MPRYKASQQSGFLWLQRSFGNRRWQQSFIEEFNVTPAQVHESQQLPELVSESDGEIWAEGTNTGPKCAAAMSKKNITGHICGQGIKGHPLSEEQWIEAENTPF